MEGEQNQVLNVSIRYGQGGEWMSRHKDVEFDRIYHFYSCEMKKERERERERVVVCGGG
jgi:hypothetical protein